MKRKTAAKKKKKAPVAQERWVAVSGGFDPLHIGHVRMFEAARKLGDKLVIILNNDNWLKDKKGFSFMREDERAELIQSLPFVDRVVVTDHKRFDTDRSVVAALRKVRPDIFANGGDRFADNIPEFAVCEELGIEMKFNVGKGGKVQSSSWMIRDAARAFARSMRPWGEFYNWDSGNKWHLKTIYIRPESRLSLQYHKNRSEWWVLVEGDATAVTIGNDKKQYEEALKLGEIFRIDKEQSHRLTSKHGGVVVEIAHGDFDEEDIVRIEDDYNRS